MQKKVWFSVEVKEYDGPCLETKVLAGLLKATLLDNYQGSYVELIGQHTGGDYGLMVYVLEQLNERIDRLAYRCMLNMHPRVQAVCSGGDRLGMVIDKDNVSIVDELCKSIEMLIGEE